MTFPTTQTPTTFTQTPETYALALNSLFTGSPSSTESDLSKLFTLTFTQRSNSSTRNFPEFVSHISNLRTILPPGSVNITMTHHLSSPNGHQVSSRHSSPPIMLEDGRMQWGETFMWVQVAEDGRIEWLVESVKRIVTEVGEEGPVSMRWWLDGGLEGARE